MHQNTGIIKTKEVKEGREKTTTTKRRKNKEKKRACAHTHARTHTHTHTTKTITDGYFLSGRRGIKKVTKWLTGLNEDGKPMWVRVPSDSIWPVYAELFTRVSNARDGSIHVNFIHLTAALLSVRALHRLL